MGLWTAIQLKLRRPDYSIVVFEKYSEYQRSHVLSLEKRSFSNAVESIQHLGPLEDLLKFKANPTRKSVSALPTVVPLACNTTHLAVTCCQPPSLETEPRVAGDTEYTPPMFSHCAAVLPVPAVAVPTGARANQRPRECARAHCVIHWHYPRTPAR